MQNIIVFVIIAISIALTIVYFIRMFYKIGKKKSSCSCCEQVTSCKNKK